MSSRTLALAMLACSITFMGSEIQAQSLSNSESFSVAAQSEVVPAVDSRSERFPDEGIQFVACHPQSVFCDQTSCVPSAFDFSNVPQTRVFPRPGNFFIPPTGPGYYSVVDQLHGRRRDKPQQSGYPAFAIMAPGFFDADFRYLDSVPMQERRPFERLKRIRIGDDFMFSTGGAAWIRYHHEVNARLTETDNSFALSRLRVYGDLWYQDRVRAFVEFISAGSSGGELPPLPIDEDWADLLNAFADVKLAEVAEYPVYARIGRQEVLLGSQRLISPLPWANKRRNFDGVRVFRQGEKFDVDAFWLRPVLPDNDEFDEPDYDQQFAGTWFTYRPEKGHFLDFYYLYYDNANAVVQQGITRAPTTVNTVGGRYSGARNNFLWDVEAAVQFGETANRDLIAGMGTVGGGYHWSGICGEPTLWLYYDYASGDANPDAGQATTFHQLFPFGHYYLGWADIAGRQNIQDANIHLSMYPVPWLTVWLQYHHLWLAQSRDALYNAGGAAIRRDPTGNAGSNVGDEIDLVLNFHIDAQSDVFVAYAQVFGGSFLEATATPTRAADTEALYLIYNFRW